MSHWHSQGTKRPGRVTRPGLLFLALLALAGCAPSSIPSIAPGYAPTDSSTGILFLRVEGLDADGVPESPPGNRHLVRLVREATGDSELYAAESEGPSSDFYLALPAGWYRMVFATGYGFTEHWYVLRLPVKAGAVSYSGMIRFYHRMYRLDRFTPYDEYPAASERLRKSHPELGAKLEKSLLEMYDARGTELQQQPWQGPAHENPEYR